MATQLDRAISKRLRLFRNRAGWSQERLAEVIEVDPATMSKYETAKFPIPVEVLGRVGTALGVPLTRLVDVETGTIPREMRPSPPGRPSPRKADTAVLLKAWAKLRPRDRRAILEICRILEKL